VIDSRLIFAYERAAGPVQSTLFLVLRNPETEARVEAMMREVIAGKRGPLTNAELCDHLPRMVTPQDLWDEYERVTGPVRFTYARISPEDEDKLREMMVAAIRGERGPITDEELGLDIPPDAES
jgi:hypothetical protein